MLISQKFNSYSDYANEKDAFSFIYNINFIEIKYFELNFLSIK